MSARALLGSGVSSRILGLIDGLCYTARGRSPNAYNTTDVSLKRQTFSTLSAVTACSPQAASTTSYTRSIKFKKFAQSITARTMSNVPLAPVVNTVSAVPRPSASVLIINGRNEILMVHRNPKSTSYGGLHVFPGGNYDSKQDDSLAKTAIRETFEESGLLLASSARPHAPDLSDSLLESARRSIHSQTTLFEDFLASHSLRSDIDSLLPFTSWITPISVPRRFHTQFYLTFLPAVSSSGFSSGDKEERIPTPDGGQEIISTRFLHPADAIEEFHVGKIRLMPPQYYLLSTLTAILEGRVNTDVQRARVEQLAKGPFGRMTIQPVPIAHPTLKDIIIFAYEGDELRGGSKGCLHRALVHVGKGGVPLDMVMERNFDIFTHTEAKVNAIKPKL